MPRTPTPEDSRLIAYVVVTDARTADRLRRARDQAMGYPRGPGSTAMGSKRRHMAATTSWRDNIAHPARREWAVAFDAPALSVDGETVTIDGLDVTIDASERRTLDASWFAED